MDISFKCDCGNNTFWYFDEEDKIRCMKCYREHRLNTKRQREFNHEEHKYEEWK